MNPGIFGERIALLVALCLHTVLVVTRVSRFWYRNWVRSKDWARAEIIQHQEALELNIKVPRPWRVMPGQFVYVCAPRVSFSSIFQPRPFSVAFWLEDNKGNSTSISLLIKPQKGFTNKLMKYAKDQTSHRRLLIGLDGPYGQAIDTRPYCALLLFATGIGVASKIPLIKWALEEHRSRRNAVRRIHLVWQLEHECR